MGIFTSVKWASYCQDGMTFLGLAMGMFPMFYRYFCWFAIYFPFLLYFAISSFCWFAISCFFAISGDIYQPYFLNKGAHCRMSKIGHRNRWGMMKGMWIINSMLSHIREMPWGIGWEGCGWVGENWQSTW